MQTADERFDYSVWFVLDKIREAMIPNKSEISYLFDINVKRLHPITFWNEKRAIDYLLAEKVIQEIGEPDVEECGEKGKKDYSVSERRHFKIKRKFFDFHDRYCLKVYPKKSEKHIKLKKRLLQGLINSKFSGKSEKKLLQILSSGSKTASEIENETGAKNIYHLISNVRKKLKKTPFKIEGIKSGTFKEYKKYRLVIS